jgi:hypothetical protein
VSAATLAPELTRSAMIRGMRRNPRKSHTPTLRHAYVAYGGYVDEGVPKERAIFHRHPEDREPRCPEVHLTSSRWIPQPSREVSLPEVVTGAFPRKRTYNQFICGVWSEDTPTEVPSRTSYRSPYTSISVWAASTHSGTKTRRHAWANCRCRLHSSR